MTDVHIFARSVNTLRVPSVNLIVLKGQLLDWSLLCKVDESLDHLKLIFAKILIIRLQCQVVLPNFIGEMLVLLQKLVCFRQ